MYKAIAVLSCGHIYLTRKVLALALAYFCCGLGLNFFTGMQRFALQSTLKTARLNVSTI
ncbi:MAG: hypothetical protein ACE5DQ_01450 [Candidatus Paceibacterota bacterium]